MKGFFNFGDSRPFRGGGQGAHLLEADDIGNSHAEHDRKEDGDDQQNREEAHEGPGAFGKLQDLLGEFGLLFGVFLDGFREGGDFVFEEAHGALVLAGVEGEGALIGLEPGDRFLERFEVDWNRVRCQQVGGGRDDVAFEQRKHFADQGQDCLGDADGAFELAGLFRLADRAGERGGGCGNCRWAGSGRFRRIGSLVRGGTGSGGPGLSAV